MKKRHEKNAVDDYQKDIDFLVKSITNLELRADVKQELLMFLIELLIKIEQKKELIKDINDYVFISLKNQKNSLLKGKYKPSYFVEANSIPDTTNSDSDDQLLDVIDNLIERNLSNTEKSIIHMYYYEKLTTKEIAAKFDVTQQAISKKLVNARKKLKAAYHEINLP